MRYLSMLFVAVAALAAEARFVDPEIEKAPVVQMKKSSVPGKADSLLPRGKTWKLVWHDEFDGAEIDKTKWMCRESFWGQDFPAFAPDRLSHLRHPEGLLRLLAVRHVP